MLATFGNNKVLAVVILARSFTSPIWQITQLLLTHWEKILWSDLWKKFPRYETTWRQARQEKSIPKVHIFEVLISVFNLISNIISQLRSQGFSFPELKVVKLCLLWLYRVLNCPLCPFAFSQPLRFIPKLIATSSHPFYYAWRHFLVFALSSDRIIWSRSSSSRISLSVYQDVFERDQLAWCRVWLWQCDALPLHCLRKRTNHNHAQRWQHKAGKHARTEF